MSQSLKRVCFDLSCNLSRSVRDPFISDPAQARAYYSDRECRFHGATAFQYSRQRYIDFLSPEDLLNCLLSADEIITFNGRIYDYIALEKLFGVEACEPLWKKPHHDLAGWKGWRLKDSVKVVAPNRYVSLEASFKLRKARIEKKCDEGTAITLADTYRDVRYTRCLFEAYLASGSTSHSHL